MPPRRGASRNNTVTDPGPSVQLAPDPFAEEYKQLRTHWKWANLSQFFFTFSQLFAMDDVSLNVSIQITLSFIPLATSHPNLHRLVGHRRRSRARKQHSTPPHHGQTLVYSIL